MAGFAKWSAPGCGDPKSRASVGPRRPARHVPHLRMRHLAGTNRSPTGFQRLHLFCCCFCFFCLGGFLVFLGGPLPQKNKDGFLLVSTWVEKTTPWTVLVSLCPSIGQYRVVFLCIGLQCFGSSISKVVTFPYKCSMRSTLCQLPAPAGKSQLSSTSVVRKVHFGSSSWKVATFQ